MGTATDALKERMARASKASSGNIAANTPSKGELRAAERPDDEDEQADRIAAMSAAPEYDERESYAESTPLSRALRKVASVEVESVIGNALVRVRFERGTNPAEVLELLHLFDPSAQVRAEFPSKSFGPRETKSAPLSTITFSKNGVALMCDLGDDESFTLNIWSDKVKAFTDKLKTCPLLTEKHLAKIEKPKDGDAIKAEKLGLVVKYSQSGEKRYFEDLVIETVKEG